MYAEKGIVYSREFLDLAEKRQEALRASGAFDERASTRAEVRQRRAVGPSAPRRDTPSPSGVMLIYCCWFSGHAEAAKGLDCDRGGSPTFDHG
jgi:hypothetical protein